MSNVPPKFFTTTPPASTQDLIAPVIEMVESDRVPLEVRVAFPTDPDLKPFLVDEDTPPIDPAAAVVIRYEPMVIYDDCDSPTFHTRQLALQGFSTTMAAKTLRLSVEQTGERAERIGMDFRKLAWRFCKNSDPGYFRKMVANLPDAEAADFLLDFLEFLMSEDQDDALKLMTAYKFTSVEARLFACLEQADGETVSIDRLLKYVYGARPVEEWPNEHSIRVHLHRVKAKLAAKGIDPESIVTIQGGGYAYKRKKLKSAA